MSILVIAKNPELFWNVRNALINLNLPIKHIPNIQLGEECILHELPSIVILTGDDSNISPVEFIENMKNSVFVQETRYIVVTSDTSPEFKEALLKAGTDQIFYQGIGFNFSPIFFSNYIKWFLDSKKPNEFIFEYQAISVNTDADFSTDGRLRWISPTHCLIETNIDLAIGQPIVIEHQIFSDLEMKDVKVKCVLKNKAGRDYNYNNSLILKLSTKNQIKDSQKVENWIQNNLNLSKRKDIKILFFESDPDERSNILKIVKSDKSYTARGYTTIDELEENLFYQLPQLILINRAMIQNDLNKFKIIQDFLKKNFCYCITYSTTEPSEIDKFNKDYSFAIHFPTPINIKILEAMIAKLEVKVEDKINKEELKFFPNKNSQLSYLTLHATAKLTEFAINDIGLELPFSVSNLSTCNISCHLFRIANTNRTQSSRSFASKPATDSPKQFYHRLIFMGQSVKEIELIKKANEEIEKLGYDEWLQINSKKTDLA